MVEVGMAILDGNTFLYWYPYFNHQFYSVVFYARCCLSCHPRVSICIVFLSRHRSAETQCWKHRYVRTSNHIHNQ